MTTTPAPRTAAGRALFRDLVNSQTCSSFDAEHARKGILAIEAEDASPAYYYPPGTTGIVPPGIDPETGMRWSRDRDPFLRAEAGPPPVGSEGLREALGRMIRADRSTGPEEWAAARKQARAALAPLCDGCNECRLECNCDPLTGIHAAPAPALDVETFIAGLDSPHHSPESRRAWIALFYGDMKRLAYAEQPAGET